MEDAHMAGIGQILRETREAKGLTLDDVEQKIRIRSSYLEALENEDYDRLPGAVYVRGFLRNYARFLGVDLEENDPDNPAVQAVATRPRPGNTRPLQMNEPMAVPLEQSRSRLILGLFVALVIIAALAGGGYWVYRTYFAGGQMPFQLPAFLLPAPTATATATETTTFTPTIVATPTETFTPIPSATPTASTVAIAQSTPAPDASDTPTPEPTVSATVTHTPAPTRTPTVTPTPTEKVYRGVEVSIVLRERSWLQVTVDGVRVHEGILEPGDTRKWEGVRSVALRAGNAGGVVVKLNGELLGPLGEDDEVIDIEWVYSGPIEIENPNGSGAVAAIPDEPPTTEGIAGVTETPTAPNDLPG
jgi:cytoskeleton protein RodZ